MATPTVSTRDSITDEELTECDRERLHHIAKIQGGAGHFLFIRYPSGRILAHDRDIRRVSWIKIKEANQSSSDLQEPGGEKSLIGSDLGTCCPEDIAKLLFSDIEQLAITSSPRTFRFYSYKNKAYAISLSSNVSDFSVVGVEIEEVDAEEVSISRPRELRLNIAALLSHLSHFHED
jgi:hypothetical protein